MALGSQLLLWMVWAARQALMPLLMPLLVERAAVPPGWLVARRQVPPWSLLLLQLYPQGQMPWLEV
jgi:hypothetical protein